MDTYQHVYWTRKFIMMMSENVTANEENNFCIHSGLGKRFLYWMLTITQDTTSHFSFIVFVYCMYIQIKKNMCHSRESNIKKSSARNHYRKIKVWFKIFCWTRIFSSFFVYTVFSPCSCYVWKWM